MLSADAFHCLVRFAVMWDVSVKSCLRKDSKLISESDTTIGSTFEISNWNKDTKAQKLRIDFVTMINRNDGDQQMKILQCVKDRFEQMASYVWTKFHLIFDPIAPHISNVPITGRFMYGYFLGAMFGQYVYMCCLLYTSPSPRDRG